MGDVIRNCGFILGLLLAIVTGISSFTGSCLALGIVKVKSSMVAGHPLEQIYPAMTYRAKPKASCPSSRLSSGPLCKAVPFRKQVRR